jgi:hypothetical protein
VALAGALLLFRRAAVALRLPVVAPGFRVGAAFFAVVDGRAEAVFFAAGFLAVVFFAVVCFAGAVCDGGVAECAFHARSRSADRDA